MRYCATLLLLVLSGCANPPKEPCHSLDCIKQGAREELAAQCRSDLFRHPDKPRQEQEAINNKYRYPYTNAETYAFLMRTGSGGMSPYRWCQKYSEAMIK